MLLYFGSITMMHDPNTRLCDVAHTWSLAELVALATQASAELERRSREGLPTPVNASKSTSALATIPNFTIHYGHFVTRTATRRLVKDRKGKPAFADVWITEEKGSDVNLASHLLIDGFRARYDLAVVVSNDGDLKDPVHFIRHELKAPPGVLNPHGNRSYALSPRSLPRGSFYKPIRRNALRASQFPAQVPDTKGINPQAGWLVGPKKTQRPPEGGLASLPPRRTGECHQ